MKPRPGLVDDADDIQVPVIGELMVQSANDVQLRRSLAFRLAGTLQDLLIRHDVARGALQVGTEGTKSATVDTDIRRVEMLVDVVIGGAAVLPLADQVGQLSEREK